MLPDERRDSKEARGDIETGSLQKSRRLALNAKGIAPPKERDKGSWWAGMSGSAVFSGSLLLGVVIIHPKKTMTPQALVGVPVWVLAELATFTDVLERHGVHMVLEDARARGAGGKSDIKVLSRDLIEPRFHSVQPFGKRVYRLTFSVEYPGEPIQKHELTCKFDTTGTVLIFRLDGHESYRRAFSLVHTGKLIDEYDPRIPSVLVRYSCRMNSFTGARIVKIYLGELLAGEFRLH
ncbi:hypothetical protein OG851_42825 (plasmid) [Streptomyces sp. NBC_00161]|uniref:hypothetical protein n=1 Tax=Streptomyces sp. NBC_00161 TaxID=2975671 RepID=UPI002F90C6B9